MSHETEILAPQSNVSSVSRPEPRVPIAIRVATLADLPFVDALQKKHAKQVGWMPTKQLEGKIAAGHVLIAEENQTADNADCTDGKLELSASSAISVVKSPVGYCIGHDQYFKRDDVGIIYQLNVSPNRQRGLIGATLIKAMFDRAAYGCKLFCCWCAQDIEANHFWESIGFVPLAFRAGSRGKQRVHIFWQRRIRAGDATTPYWFPSQTTAGSIREDRLVLPIPPGTHWSDAKPLILPGDTHTRRLEDGGAGRWKAKEIRPVVKIARKRSPLSGGLKFQGPQPAATKVGKPKREKRPKLRNDPKLVAAARELRDRWLEQVNAAPLPSAGKYDLCSVRREFPQLLGGQTQMPLIEAA